LVSGDKHAKIVSIADNSTLWKKADICRKNLGVHFGCNGVWYFGLRRANATENRRRRYYYG